MEIVNKQANKHKSKLFKSMMSNKSISDALFDAWDAPVGSTKKKKAESIIRSLNVTSQRSNMDGQGGPYSGAMSSPMSSLSGLLPNQTPQAQAPRQPQVSTGQNMSVEPQKISTREPNMSQEIMSRQQTPNCNHQRKLFL